jgi:outer membrane protein insertion porin family
MMALAAVFAFASVSVFSQAAEWYQGKLIRDITFTGLKNVDIRKLQPITDPYKGRAFTDEVFTELQNKLYASEYFEIIIPSAIRADREEAEVIINFEVSELPRLSGIVFSGNAFFSDERLSSLLKNAGLEKDAFASAMSTRLAEKAIANAYEARGFYDAEVKADMKRNEDNTCDLTVSIHEGLLSFVEAVRFEGNTVFTDGELEKYLVQQSQGVFNSGLVGDCTADTDALTRCYADNGYIDMSSAVPKITENRVEGDFRFITVTYNITREGEQCLFGGLRFSGNSIFSDEELSALVHTLPGSAYNAGAVGQDVQRIKDRYFDEGYITSSFITIEGRDGNVLSPLLKITEKEKMYIENIIVRGNRQISTREITERLSLQPGDVFSLKKVQNEFRKLSGLSLLSNANYTIEGGSKTGLLNLVIIVEEEQ